METVVVAFFVMLALVGAMAVGVIFGRQPTRWKLRRESSGHGNGVRGLWR